MRPAAWPRFRARVRAPITGAALAFALNPGCAAGVSNFAPAHVGPKGQWSGHAGVDLAIPTGGIGPLVDAGKTLAQAARSRTLSEDEKIRVFAAGVNLALNAPGFVQHFSLAYNPVARWQLVASRIGGAWKLGGRHQLLAQDVDGADGSVGLALSRYSYGPPAIIDVIDVIHLDDFQRWTIDVPMAIGRHGRYHRWWTGPKFTYVHHTAQLVLRTPGQAGAPAQEDVASTSGSASYWGGYAGAALGYRSVFIATELTIVRLIGTAELNVFGRTTSADTSSWVISPGIALLGEF